MIDCKRIKELRCKKNYTQSKLSSLLGVSRSAVSMWEIGGSEPDTENIAKMAELFDVSTDYILGRDEPTNSENSELYDYLEELRTRPEMKMLFNITKNATKEEVEKAVKIIEAMLSD